MKTQRRFITALVGLAAVVLVNSAAAEEKTVSVIIPWTGEGHVYQIGLGQFQFQGHLDGIAYAESASGDLDEGLVSCPVIQTIRADGGEASGRGHCSIIMSGEDSVFAEFTCAGKVGGCSGEFRLTGGTGRFKGISGSSKLIIRSPLHEMALNMSNGSIVRAGAGLARLPALKFTLPGS